MWEEAYKVAQTHGSGNSHKQVRSCFVMICNGDEVIKVTKMLNRSKLTCGV